MKYSSIGIVLILLTQFHDRGTVAFDCVNSVSWIPYNSCWIFMYSIVCDLYIDLNWPKIRFRTEMNSTTIIYNSSFSLHFIRFLPYRNQINDLDSISSSRSVQLYFILVLLSPTNCFALVFIRDDFDKIRVHKEFSMNFKWASQFSTLYTARM